MQLLRTSPSNETQVQATFGMANLRQKTTGLPFIVFISQKDDANHSARVKVSPQPKVRTDLMSSYSISPFEFKQGPRLSSTDERLLADWISVNQRVLVDYWNGDIEYTEDAIDQLKRV